MPISKQFVLLQPNNDNNYNNNYGVQIALLVNFLIFTSPFWTFLVGPIERKGENWIAVRVFDGLFHLFWGDRSLKICLVISRSRFQPTSPGWCAPPPFTNSRVLPTFYPIIGMHLIIKLKNFLEIMTHNPRLCALGSTNRSKSL